MTVIGNGKIIAPGTPVVEPNPLDPPVFLLLASPTWAPWLPDTVYQKIPIGANGQVLTVQGDGSVNWQNNAAGFANPMSAAGDLIEGGAGGTPTRFPIGTNGQVLTVVGGVLGWVNNSTVGFTNPMTTSQDLIVGGAAGAAGRLGVGANGQVLTVSAGGLVVWQNSAAGFANPMTTAGDLIDATTGGTPQRLPIGANGQVLSVVAGAPAWANSPTGFANPMTAAGDMITGGLVGAAQRLPIGASGQVLTVVSGAPAWAAGQTAASAVVFPSGDTTGVTDQAAITSAQPANGGEILLAAGAFYVKPTSGLICLTINAQTTPGAGGGNPVSVRGLGPVTTIFPVGAGVTGISYHRTSGYGAQYGLPAQHPVGFIRDLTIDGTNTTGAAIGLDFGDGWGHDIDVTIVNFTGTGAIAANLITHLSGGWTEKTRVKLNVMNNTNALVVDTSFGNAISHEYSDFLIYMFLQPGQNGITLQNNVNCAGCSFFIRGNAGGAASPVTTSILGLTGGANIGNSFFDAKVEGNPVSGNVNYPASISTDATSTITKCTGLLSFSVGSASLLGPEFSFQGLADGGGLSVTTPAVPASGAQQKNLGPSAIVSISGGTVTNVSLNGIATGLTSGPFFLQAGGYIVLTYSAAPTWVWSPANYATF